LGFCDIGIQVTEAGEYVVGALMCRFRLPVVSMNGGCSVQILHWSW